MSHLIVLAFDDAGEVEKVRSGLRSQQKEELVSLDDAAIVSRDAEGKLHVKNEVSRATDDIEPAWTQRPVIPECIPVLEQPADWESTGSTRPCQ